MSRKGIRHIIGFATLALLIRLIEAYALERETIGLL